ncbi:glycoside hydrolase, family 76 [Coniochaeta sp. 2T2.1]|nr:glycoside hydrolase, family 76 [Coniochaeta sp. 2T2.1]
MLLPYTWGVVLLRGTAALSGGSFFTQSNNAAVTIPEPDLGALEHALEALHVMQVDYFQPWLGQWPTSIDWTAAVLGSHVSGALGSLSLGLGKARSARTNDEYKQKENLIALYFSQLIGYYFGQDAFAIRNEAFDDMLWVVLGWLDTKRFIDLHTKLHYGSFPKGVRTDHPTFLHNQTWHGNIWIPAFTHRARIFWDLAFKGWDEKLCGGGMTWNPRLEPYKNAITNELFISAAIAMYFHFPGDSNSSPFTTNPSSTGLDGSNDTNIMGLEAHDGRFLETAIRAYHWLKNSGMTNHHGLYVDGFHISGYNNRSSNNTKCDARNEMVYTYNQGVLLSGLRGLFKATGVRTYIRDGHQLIQNVIRATGYSLQHDRPMDDLSRLKPGQLPPWRGIGRAGVLEDVCDSRGDCSQNSHTFKGIYFHHLAAFCAPLDIADGQYPGLDFERRFKIRKEHARACQAYLGWIKHNSAAALYTRDEHGKFGMWWTAGLLNVTLDILEPSDGSLSQHGLGPANTSAVDYRTFGIPNNAMWVGAAFHTVERPEYVLDEKKSQRPFGPVMLGRRLAEDPDPNNRGRGRTVETQAGGLAVLRALWEFSTLDPGYWGD